MTPLTLYSEPFAKTGNIAGEGFRRLLGRPALGLLQTVIREAIQNSVDAAPEGSPVDVKLRYRVLIGEELERFRKLAFSHLPPMATEPEDIEDGEKHNIHGVLEGSQLGIFEICDFNTTGLGGPTRADAVSAGEKLDFVNFLRNVGAARDTNLGGGTYGYGKTSLYALSRCSTIIADSQTTSAGRPVRRIMGCHLGNAFEDDRSGTPKRYTGRHWWGQDDGDGGVDPVEGDDAVRLALALGLPERNEGLTGTTIAIIAPHVDDVATLPSDLVESILWNFWPRMCASTPSNRKLAINLEIEGVNIPIPEPESFPPLDLFAQALAQARIGEGEQVHCQRPKALLGNLAITHGMRSPRAPIVKKTESLIPRAASHIALMRPVELVVRYLPGEAFPDDRLEWAGVFICSNVKDIERAFADAEPPAHDDWSPDMLPKGREKTFVNVALREIRQAAQTFALPKNTTTGTGEKGPSLAGTATKLGKLLGQTSSKGPGRSASPSGGGTRKKISISPPRFVKLETIDDKRTAFFEAHLKNDGSKPDMLLIATPQLVIDGSLEDATDLPPGYEISLLDLTLRGEETVGNAVRIGSNGGSVVCRVTMPDDAAVGVKFTFDEGDAA
ncbi:ATP-binding protein [Paracoccus zeaxanthinifaciens]|uniref:ATP-binding protein n=1 Tax=Paracoccus zeaxanthinifaciens TaxID=187400 RepID=UPI0003B7A4AF|nr:ATP-binding protein [Paracoccus zeaxanthinifaciens]